MIKYIKKKLASKIENIYQKYDLYYDFLREDIVEHIDSSNIVVNQYFIDITFDILFFKRFYLYIPNRSKYVTIGRYNRDLFCSNRLSCKTFWDDASILELLLIYYLFYKLTYVYF